MWYALIIISILFSQLIINGSCFIDEVSILLLGLYLLFKKLETMLG